jgi:hypothetical protein
MIVFRDFADGHHELTETAGHANAGALCSVDARKRLKIHYIFTTSIINFCSLIVSLQQRFHSQFFWSVAAACSRCAPQFFSCCLCNPGQFPALFGPLCIQAE